MRPLAAIAQKMGFVVTGSDKQTSPEILGARLWAPHDPSALQEPDLCVVSTAITPDNPELFSLRQAGCPIIHRSDFLTLLAKKHRRQIVVTGTHGKTSTSFLLAWILNQGGGKRKATNWVIGGKLLPEALDHYWDPENESIVYEGDESDQSFLKGEVDLGIVTSLEPDHLENYQNSFAVQQAKFRQFALKAKLLIAWAGIPELRELAQETYGLASTEADWKIDPDQQVSYRNQNFGTLELPSLTGQHNALNALAAIAAARACGVKPIDALEALSRFPGIARRFELVGITEQNIALYDDYAHHASEVEAAIATARSLADERGGRLIVLFQPHLPTRLRDLWEQFQGAFGGADALILLPLYIARGLPIEGVSSEALAPLIKNTRVFYEESFPQGAFRRTIELAKPNDLVLMLGAGDLSQHRETLLSSLRLSPSQRI